MDKMPLEDVCEQLGMDAKTVRERAKERLTYRTEYMAHPRYALVFDSDVIERLKDQSIFEPTPGDTVLRAKVCQSLPPNERYIWIRGKDINGRGTCQIPKRWAKWYRVPKKIIKVRHVEGNIYQIVHRDGSK